MGQFYSKKSEKMSLMNSNYEKKTHVIVAMDFKQLAHEQGVINYRVDVNKKINISSFYHICKYDKDDKIMHVNLLVQMSQELGEYFGETYMTYAVNKTMGTYVDEYNNPQYGFIYQIELTEREYLKPAEEEKMAHDLLRKIMAYLREYFANKEK